MLIISKKDEIIAKINRLPDKLIDEVFDFINYLREKMVKENIETAIISESSLKKDWLRPEEDEAWRDLKKEILL